MSNNLIQPSFAAGELSPSLWGRTDMAKYKIGAAKMRNFFVDYRGGASTRSGTKFVGRTKIISRVSRLIPFTFSTFNTYMLEFGHQYMRVILNGAYVLEPSVAVSGVSQANPGQVTTGAAHGFTTGDTVYLSGIGGMTQLNGVTCLVTVVSSTTFTIQNLDGVNINTSAYTAYTSGGTVSRVYTLVTPYVEADITLLKFAQSADTMTITHVNYQSQNLTRTQHYAWTLSPINMASTVNAPVNISNGVSMGSGAIGHSIDNTYYSYTVTAVSQDGQESLSGTPTNFLASYNITTTEGEIFTYWNPVDGAAYYNVYRAPISLGQAVPPGPQMGYVGHAYGGTFTDPNITPDWSKQPPQHRDPFAPGQITGWTITNGGSGYNVNSAVATITDPTGSGANLIPVIIGGALVGFIILNAGKNYTSPSVSISTGSGAVVTLKFSAMTGSYPGTVAYFQQRKAFAASILSPTTLWLSKPGAFANFDFSNPINDGDALTLSLASTQVNAVKSMVAMPGGLVVFTSGAVWQISSGQGANMPITPSSVVATPQAYNGSSDVPPIPINYDILYVQAKGSIVRDLQYNLFANIYTSQDITIFSNHLFMEYQIKEWAFAESPFKTIWAVRSDGKLLSLTFIKEQELMGWAWHDTIGEFESVAVIQEGQHDVVYFVVKRYINGQWVRCVERMADRQFLYGAEDSWALDCALNLPLNTPAANLTISAATGVVTVTADASVFNSGMVGWVFRAGEGIGTVTAYTSGTQITVTLTRPIGDTLPDGRVVIQTNDSWSVSQPVTVISGLDHLEGQTVTALADGIARTGLVVTGGKITLPVAATKVIVGIPFQCQLQTLYLDTGEPTSQGKRKKISAVTLRQSESQGLKVGWAWNNINPLKYPTTDLLTGDARIVLPPGYTTEAQLCIQQDSPFPATVLAVIPEVSLGDTDPRS